MNVWTVLNKVEERVVLISDTVVRAKSPSEVWTVKAALKRMKPIKHKREF